MNHQTLDPDILVQAYRQGAFPMADPQTGRISWFSPDPRAIIPLDKFQSSRSIRQIIKKKVFEVRIDCAFNQVIHGCAERDETWISPEIIQVYCELHTQGLAHSVESWHDGHLAGGLYGVAIGGAFFGESMFTRVDYASSVALVHLVSTLRERHFQLLDTQFLTPHLVRFGAVEIPRKSYLRFLEEALDVVTTFSKQL